MDPASHRHLPDGHSGIGGDVEGGGAYPCFHQLGADSGDHRAIVCAQAWAGTAECYSRLFAPFSQEPPQAGVGGHASAQQHGVDAVILAGVDGFGCEDIGDGFLEAGSHIGDGDLLTVTAADLHPTCHGGLQTGERKVETVLFQVVAGGQAAREGDRFRISFTSQLVDHRAAWIRKSEQAGDLVVRLPRRVVDGGPDLFDVSGDIAHAKDVRVAPGDEKRH